MKLFSIVVLLLTAVLLSGAELRIADAIPGGDAPVRQLALREAFAGRQQIQYQHEKAPEAFAGLAEGKYDLVVAELPDRPEKFPGNCRIYAVDSLVFYVNVTNTLEGAKSAQLRDIFTQQQPNWQDYSFLSTGIQRYGVKAGKPGAARMAHFLPRSSVLAEEVKKFGSTAEVLAMTGANPDAIGFGVYASSAPVQVRLLAVDGVEPNMKTVAEATYPLAVKRAVFTSADPSAETRRFLKEMDKADFRDFILNAELLPVEK